MYEVVVDGSVEGTIRVALDGLVDAWAGTSGHQVLRVTDQARLVALINRLHELGMSIDAVRRCGTTR
jgi:hypothetical protein